MSETSEIIQLSGQFSWSDHKHVNRLIVPLRKRIVVHGVAVLLVFIVISAFRLQAPIGPIAFAIFVAIYLVMLWRLQRRKFVEWQVKREDNYIEIDDSGVLVRAAEQESRFAASVFETVTRDDQFMVLHGRELGGLPVVVLKKSWCHRDDDWTRVEQVVAKWLPPVAGVLTTEWARQFRRERLPAEYALKRSVFLLLAVSLVLTLVAFVTPFNVVDEHGAWYVFLFRVQTMIATVVCCLTAWGVRRLAAWSRLPLQVISALCLPLFPFGTVMGARILYLLATGSEPRLLTFKYEQIVRVTGPMKIQNPSRKYLWGVLLLVLAFVVLIIGLVYLISLIPEDIRHNL